MLQNPGLDSSNDLPGRGARGEVGNSRGGDNRLDVNTFKPVVRLIKPVEPHYHMAYMVAIKLDIVTFTLKYFLQIILKGDSSSLL